MNQLQRYIMKHIIYTTLLIGGMIAGILFLLALLGEAKNIGEGNYHFIQAVGYVLMRLPGLVYEFESVLLLLGSIGGLSILVMYREIIAMRVAGFSKKQLIYSVMGAAIVLMFVISGIGESLVPQLNTLAELHKENNQNAGETLRTTDGVWLHVKHNFIRIEHIINHQWLEGVTRYQFDDKHRLVAVYHAQLLIFKNDQWVMYHVSQTRFYKDQVKSTLFQTLPWQLTWNVNLLHQEEKDLSKLSLMKLSHLIHYLKQNGLRVSEYQYEFWQRLLQPLVSLAMIFIAIPFVMNAISTVSLGMRMMIGAMVGLSFFMLNTLLGQICVVYQVPAVIAAGLPLLIVVLITVILNLFFKERYSL